LTILVFFNLLSLDRGPSWVTSGFSNEDGNGVGTVVKTDKAPRIQVKWDSSGKSQVITYDHSKGQQTFVKVVSNNFYSEL